MKTELKTAAQKRTYKIFESLPKYELLHLCSEGGLSDIHYNSHVKRAVGLTVHFYSADGLTASMGKFIMKKFANVV